jgi:hypothetical protein
MEGELGETALGGEIPIRNWLLILECDSISGGI